MALGPRLDLRPTQQLVLTPQLQQAIKLLQMANLELGDFVHQEIEQNPLLEVADREPGGVEDANGEPIEPAASDALEDGIYAADSALTGDSMIGERESPLDADYEGNVFDDAPLDSAGGSSLLGMASGGAGRGGTFEGDDEGFESRLGERPDLKDHLSRQVHLLLATADDRIVAAYLIDLLDEAGYLAEGPDEICERLGCSREHLDRVLGVLKTAEPCGVFARDLAECLALQLAERDRLDPAMQALIDNLDLLARRDLAALKKLCGVDDEDLADMIREIRALDPKPGLAFGGEAVQPVVPDVFVRRTPAGGWTVELNNDTLPKVLINRHYYAELSARSTSRKDKQYLSECLSNASWLVRALDQRARTILKVSSEIVRQQEAFLTHGVRHLKPLTLRDIAEAIDMHESTVSRVTSAKYMATNRGIFELKYFFTSAIQSAAGGDAVSSEAVRDRIRALIDAEDPDTVLSDDALVAMLRAEGIDIARRTVAKYREALRIPSSVQRRRAKRALG